MTTQRTDIFRDIVGQRRATRGFLEKEVPQDTLEEIFELAQRAPSNCNTQPWQIAVVSGQRCRQLAEGFHTAMEQGNIDMDFTYDGVYHGKYRDRQHAAASALYNAMGIPREDKTARHRAFMRNFTFFDAPHVAFFFLPEPFGIREAADLGMYAQTLMLTLTAYGLASCPQTALSFQAHIVRGELDIDDNRKLLFGLSFGYPNPEHPSNCCRTEREAIAGVVRFYR